MQKHHTIYSLSFFKQADGLGDTRTKELFNSCKILGIDTEKVQVVDDLKLQDGFEEVWEPAAVASAVSTSVDKWNINSIITFDNQGVSGHPNHIATWLGVKNMVDDKAFQDKHEDFRLWTLASTSFLRKYSGICDIFLSAWDPGAMFYSPKLWTNHAAMAAHYSQFVWYRRLFVFFSRYGYINNLVEHNSGKEDEEKRKKTQ